MQGSEVRILGFQGLQFPVNFGKLWVSGFGVRLEGCGFRVHAMFQGFRIMNLASPGRRTPNSIKITNARITPKAVPNPEPRHPSFINKPFKSSETLRNPQKPSIPKALRPEKP